MVQTKQTTNNDGVYELDVKVRRIRDGPTPSLTCAEETARCFADLAEWDREVFCVACLDPRSRLIARQTAFIGMTDGVCLSPREILRTALLTTATSIIVVHNHPSGDPSPSPEDVHATEELAKACEVVGLALLDHVIVGHDGAYWSWASSERE